MVVALEAAVEREVLLDDLGAERDGRHRYVEASLVARVADRAPADLGEPVQVAQVDVLEGCRVGGVAVQQARTRRRVLADQRRVSRISASVDMPVESTSGVPGCRGMDQQLVVGQVGGGDLQGGDAVARERVDARPGPRACTSPSDRRVAAVVEHLEELFGLEREPGQEVERVLRPEVFAGAGVVAALAIERRHVPHLELDAIGPGPRRRVDELASPVRPNRCG